jgi:hypothetical protein
MNNCYCCSMRMSYREDNCVGTSYVCDICYRLRNQSPDINDYNGDRFLTPRDLVMVVRAMQDEMNDKLADIRDELNYLKDRLND